MTRLPSEEIPDDLRSPAVLGEVVCVFTAPIRPQPKERPRVTRRGGAYTPSRTRDFENAIAWAATTAMKGRPATGEPVRLILLAEQVDRRQADLDNIVKAVADGLSSHRSSKNHAGRIGPVIRNDAQVVEIRARLVRGADRDAVTVLVEEIAPPKEQKP